MVQKTRHLSPHFDQRPEGTEVDTIIVHSMFVPDVADPYDPTLCCQTLEQYKVSAHYLITRRGAVWQLVEEKDRAWHAGVSRMPGPEDHRENVNHFSIGIELIGDPSVGFTQSQYNSLAQLSAEICARHTIRHILGHDHIAPGRKTDPGALFDWAKFAQLLQSKLKDAPTPLIGHGAS